MQLLQVLQKLLADRQYGVLHSCAAARGRLTGDAASFGFEAGVIEFCCLHRLTLWRIF